MLQLNSDSIEISYLKLVNSEIHNYFKSLAPEDYVTNIIKIIEIGTAVMSRVSTSQNIDYIDSKVSEIFTKINNQFQMFDKQMRSILEASLDPKKTDSFMSQASSIISSQNEIINANLSAILRATQESIIRETSKLEIGCNNFDTKMNPNNSQGYLAVVSRSIDDFTRNLDSQFLETDSSSFVGRLKSIVDEHFGKDGMVLSLIEKKLEIDSDGKNPLSQIYISLRSEITSLRDVIMKLVGQQELIDTTTKKGAPFEAVVFDKLQEIAKPFGDIVEDTSLKAEAISGSKKGDYVYTVADTDIKFVLDAKNYNKLKSLPSMLSYLKDAIKERCAKVGIIVAPEIQNLQKQIGSWNVYGNCIITPLDHLEVSIKYAKYTIQLEEIEKKGLNVGLVQHKLDSIKRKIKEITTIKTKLTKLSNGVNSSVQELQSLLSDLRDEVNNQLSDVELEIRKA